MQHGENDPISVIILQVLPCCSSSALVQSCGSVRPRPEEGNHEAPQVHHSYLRRGGRVAADGAGTAVG
jgi:hypothetical protein